jgi:hypothetical protein
MPGVDQPEIDPLLIHMNKQEAKTLQNLNAGVERLNRTSQEEYFLHSFHELPDNFNDLRSFVKQKQFHYNFLRLHRSLSFNDRLFSPMKFFFIKRAICL